ncbi:MAG: MTH938/NDUFAF3 family protein [Desulfobaccales bacterium]
MEGSEASQAMHIDSYDFGHIVIDGVSYRQDVLLWPGGLNPNWWRRHAHLLLLEDVAEALAAGPEVLVVGQGQPGRLEVDPALAAYLRERQIDLVALPTREACRVINSLAGKRRLAAALHLTC